MATRIPTLMWAQRREKVFVTFECINAKDVNVVLSDGLLSLDATDSKTQVYKLENLPLWTEIDVDDSKWLTNDRCASFRARNGT